MDVQMPERDGFEATAILREKEKATGKHLPVIAMTAHALKGDRERCLEAGMDEYVSKPLQAQTLIRMVESMAAAPAFPEATAEPAAEAAADEPAFDRETALEQTQGDPELLQEIAALFLDELPHLTDAIQDALVKQDSNALERAAHKLKGSVGSFGARRAYDAAYRLEVIGREGRLAEADAAWSDLEGDVERLRAALVAFQQEESSK
jgi:CheY-like chemotaxis protein